MTWQGLVAALGTAAVLLASPALAQEPGMRLSQAEDAQSSSVPAGGSGRCSQAYHASLGQIAETEYAAVKAARDLVATGDDRLPGALLFPPSSAARTREEGKAFVAANGLARRRGSVGSRGDADSQWISERIRLDLAEYLGQKPSPYLCGGVEAYVETLRKFAGRLGASPAERQASIQAQKGAAEKAITRALLVLRPAPMPRLAPSDRPIAGLRPTTAVVREDIRSAAAMPPEAQASNAESGEDGDLPPLTPAPVRLESVADLTAAVDRLVAAAKEAGFVNATANDMAFGTGLAVTASSHPVLARLALVRPYVSPPRPLVTDRVARLALSAAFSNIEVLDYLMRDKAAGGDPMASAFDKTFEAILAARARDCVCRD